MLLRACFRRLLSSKTSTEVSELIVESKVRSSSSAHKLYRLGECVQPEQIRDNDFVVAVPNNESSFYSNMKKEFAELRQQINQLNAKIISQDAKIISQDSKIISQDSKIISQNSQINQLNQKIIELEPFAAMNSSIVAGQIISDLEFAMLNEYLKNSKIFNEEPASWNRKIAQVTKLHQKLLKIPVSKRTPDEQFFISQWDLAIVEYGSSLPAFISFSKESRNYHSHPNWRLFKASDIMAGFKKYLVVSTVDRSDILLFISKLLSKYHK